MPLGNGLVGLMDYPGDKGINHYAKFSKENF